jgi:hypothetical protein
VDDEHAGLRETARGIALLLSVGGDEAEEAWEALEPRCGHVELYEKVGAVVLEIAVKAGGQETVVKDGMRFGLTRRQVPSVTRALDELAARLEGIGASQLGRMLWPNGDPLPVELRKRRGLIEKVVNDERIRVYLGALDPVDVAEWNLVTFVREKTGNYNFEHVTTLLQAALLCGLWQDGVQKHSRSYTAEALEQRVKRFRQRLRSLSKK